jgi:hypothetical protein
MHIMKKVCESLLGILLNMPSTTKDGPKAREDLISIGIREKLYTKRPYDHDDQAEDMEDCRKGKKAKNI